MENGALYQEFTGTVTRINRGVEESQQPGRAPQREEYGDVDVDLDPTEDPRVVRVPFPHGLPEGIVLGQRVRLVFEGFDPELEAAEMSADHGHGNR